MMSEQIKVLEHQLAKAQAENQTLRNAQKTCEDCDAPTIGEFKQLKAENARLRDLLEPTVELLENYKNFMENTPLGDGPFGLPEHLFVEHSAVLAQLARLRAAREAKP